MKTNKFTKASGALSLLALIGLVSPSAQAFDEGWYGGFGLGSARTKIEDSKISSTLLGAGFTTTSVTEDENSLAWKILGGYQFNRFIAVEGGYFNLGKFDFTAQTLPPGTLEGEFKLQGINLDLVGMIPFTDRFSAFGRVGVHYAQTKDRFTGTGLVVVPDPNRRENGANYKFGAGVEYALTRSLGLRAEAERYRVNDGVGNKSDVDLFSAGLIYRFGAPPKPQPVAVAVAAAPAPVVAAAPPPPAPAPPPRPIPKRVSFSADSLYVFNSAEIQPQGKQELDQFAADLRGVSYSTIAVTGHTDAIGSEGYNQRLSEQRADTVKVYLVQNAGIPSANINATGVGESQPVTRPGDCPAERTGRVSRERIACLQPDRRVEVEVNGTK